MDISEALHAHQIHMILCWIDMLARGEGGQFALALVAQANQDTVELFLGYSELQKNRRGPPQEKETAERYHRIPTTLGVGLQG